VVALSTLFDAGGGVGSRHDLVKKLTFWHESALLYPVPFYILSS